VKDEKTYQKLAEDNHKLIYGFMHKYHLSEDWYGELAEGLCKAARIYDENMGVKFSVLAYRSMKNTMLMRFRDEGKLVKTVSLDALVAEDARDSFDCFVSERTDRIEAADEIAYFDWIIENAKLRDLEIILRRLDGQNDEEIAADYDLTRAWVSKRLVMLRERVKSGRRMRGGGEEDVEARLALRRDISERLKNCLGVE